MSDFEKVVVTRLLRELAEAQAQLRAMSALVPADKAAQVKAILDGVPEIVPRTEYERGYETAKADLAAGLKSAVAEAEAMGETATAAKLDELVTSVEAEPVKVAPPGGK